MAAHRASSFRGISSPSPRGDGGDDDDDRRRPPSPPPPFSISSSSDHRAASSGRSGGRRGAAAAASSSSGAEQPRHHQRATQQSRQSSRRKLAQDVRNRALSRKALMENDAMVYLDGPQVYTCGECRTHLTSHDDIISKSFHGRHGRAYLFDQCVNITTGPAEDRVLITGLHSVSDIYCKRCRTLVGWTYARAYEPSQKYKEGKYIVEKMFLHMEESDYYEAGRPAGERGDRWRVRSMSWGSERSASVGSHGEAMGTGGPSGGTTATTGGPPVGGSYHSRGGGGTPTRRSASAALMSPRSPISPKGIIYEYRASD